MMTREQAEKFGHYFKALARQEYSRDWCRDNSVPIVRAAGEGVNTAGGFLVPQDFDTVPLQIVPKVGAFRAGTDVRPATSDWQVRPRRYSGLTAYVTAENDTITESSFQLDAINATSKRIAILARASSELFEDSASDLGAFLATEIRNALDALEDDMAFNGDGTSTYGDVVGLGTKLSGLASGVACAAGHNLMTEVDNTDIANLVGGVETTALPTAAFYMSSAAFASIGARLSTVAGWSSILGGDGAYHPIFMGFPVMFSSKLADDATADLAGKLMILFGDLRMSSVLVQRQPTVVSLSWHRYIDTDEVAIRASRRIDIVHHSVGDATTRGYVAGLFGTT